MADGLARDVMDGHAFVKKVVASEGDVKEREPGRPTWQNHNGSDLPPGPHIAPATIITFGGDRT